MSEWDDELSQDELEGDENLNEEPIDESSAVPSEKYEKLLGEDSKKYKLSGMFKDWFLDYSSYVILQRAVPNIVDGLKPVQRRVLHAMHEHDTGAYSKVARSSVKQCISIRMETLPYLELSYSWGRRAMQLTVRVTGVTFSPA